MGGKLEMAWQLGIARGNCSMPLIAAAWPSTFCVGFTLLGVRKLPAAVWLDPKSTKKIKGFPKVPWALGSARLLSARAEGCFHLVPGEGECLGLQPKALSAHRPASDSKPYWHCRKARRIYDRGCRAVPRASAPGRLYERMGMSDCARQSFEAVNERRNYPSLVIARIYGDVSEPIITNRPNLFADRQHTRIAQTFNQHNSRNASLAVQFIDRSPVTLAKNPPWLVRCAPICVGTIFPAPGAAAAFWFFFAAEKELGHAPAMRGSIKFKNSKSLSIQGNVPIQPKRQLINTSTIHSKIY